MASGQRKTVQRGGFYARYLPSGHIVYMHEGTLFAVPFDLKRLEVTGQPAPILEAWSRLPVAGRSSPFPIPETSCISRGSGGKNVSIYWMDREGKFTPLRETPGNYHNPAFSPDGKRLALEINDGKRRDIWVYDWERDTLTRLTFAGDRNGFPVWTPDGQRITYSSKRKAGRLTSGGYVPMAPGMPSASRKARTLSTRAPGGPMARSWRSPNQPRHWH